MSLPVPARPDPSSHADPLFGQRVTVEQVEEGHELAPKFDAAGLIPCVTTDHASGRCSWWRS